MYELIQHQKLSSTAASITFSNIPQVFTDLYLVTSLRDDTANAGWENAFIYPNGSSADMTSRALYGWGSGNVGSLVNSPAVLYHQTARGNNTASTFSSSAIYVSNYRASTAKSFSVETTVERNEVAGINAITAGVWNSTAAISSLQIQPATGSFVAGSSATLYGIARSTSLGRSSQPKAIGGSITFANGYWVHTFTGSGTFVPSQNLTAEYLIIAGGGGTTFGLGGGGGAGGYRCSVQGEMSGGGVTAETPAILTANTAYPVVVGAGGAGEQLSNQSYGGQGSDSSFAGITSLGGGRGVGQSLNYPSNPPGQAGGSGSGGVRNNNTPGAGTAGQGYSGGSGSNSANGYGGGGGGGAGSVGSNGGSANGGNGGLGVTSSITGTAVARAGGGGGCVGGGTPGVGVAGGGNGGADSPAAVATSGTANTGGGGGGGDDFNGRSGGSGVVIIRYKAD
jgi:hypothetical protein